jgi:hypothetical protein
MQGPIKVQIPSKPMSRRKRVLLWVGLLVALLGAGLVGVRWWTRPTHHITMDNLEKIQGGLTEQQVETILGAPAGDYSNGRTRTWGGVNYPGGVNKKWIADDCAIEVAFAPNGRVGGVSITDARPESWIDKLRRWFGF